RGFTFVGPTIIYSYLQGIGIVNDHWEYCDYR
ncbi:MAG TPA: 3-methyladenine DNA glycosylase, partial [Acidaminococcaceae bacterium]|nr:3-methyladenine DNA glycosylase [Acidaminococcaceae bacterium]